MRRTANSTRVIVSQMKRSTDHRDKVIKHARDLMNRSTEGEFHEKTKYLTWMPDIALMPVLGTLGYDGMVIHRNGEVKSSVFFQKRGGALHAFSVYTKPRSKRDVAINTAKDFLSHARSVGVKRVRLGAGTNPAVNRVLESLKTEEKSLGIKVLKDGWVRLRK